MKLRPKIGATLGLVAVCALAVIVIGVGLYLLMLLVGGSRQLSGSVDSGILNVAKQALNTPTVDCVAAGTPEFAGQGDNGSNDISLVAYNQCVGMTLLVAMNAQASGSQQAMSNAQKLADQLAKLRTALSAKMMSNTQLTDAFDQLVAHNRPGMLGTSALVQRNNPLDYAYMKPGGSCNISFDPNSVPNGVDHSSLVNSDPAFHRAPDGEPYLKGYAPLTMGGVTVYAVPTFPYTSPHLVTMSDFANAKNLNLANVDAQTMPPNAFAGQGHAAHDSTNGALSSVAAAIVGVHVPQQNVVTTVTQQAQIPNGYLRIYNMPGAPAGSDWSSLLSDGDNDIFNKELFSPSQIVQSNNGVFTTDVEQMNAWINYNAGTGKDPRTSGYDVAAMRKGSQLGATASAQDLLGIASTICDCTHIGYTADLTGPCISKDNLDTWAANYGRNSQYSLPNNSDYTAVEWMKADVLAHRAALRLETPNQGNIAPVFNTCPQNYTGVKLFDESKSYTVPNEPVQFGAVGTPLQLMQHLGATPPVIPTLNCLQGVLQSMYQRACQFKPGLQMSEFTTVLNSKPIPQGTLLFLYKAQNGALVLDDQGPPGASAQTQIQPDCGVGSASVYVGLLYDCLANGQVNSIGDANLADRPYSAYFWGQDISPGDTAVGPNGYWPGATAYTRETGGFNPSTGSNHLLGELDFTTNVGICGIGSLQEPN